jgi:hypothetical protein
MSVKKIALRAHRLRNKESINIDMISVEIRHRIWIRLLRDNSQRTNSVLKSTSKVRLLIVMLKG